MGYGLRKNLENDDLQNDVHAAQHNKAGVALDDLDARVKVERKTNLAQNKTLNDHEKRLKAVEPTAKSASSKVVSLEKRVTTLEGKVSTHGSDISSLKSRVKTLEDADPIGGGGGTGGTGVSHDLPSGGKKGQALVKRSDSNYDAAWATVGGGGLLLPPDGDNGDVLALDGDTGDLKWVKKTGVPGGGDDGQVLTQTDDGPDWKTVKTLPSGAMNGQFLGMVDGEPTWVNAPVPEEDASAYSPAGFPAFVPYTTAASHVTADPNHLASDTDAVWRLVGDTLVGIDPSNPLTQIYSDKIPPLPANPGGSASNEWRTLILTADRPMITYGASSNVKGLYELIGGVWTQSTLPANPDQASWLSGNGCSLNDLVSADHVVVAGSYVWALGATTTPVTKWYLTVRPVGGSASSWTLVQGPSNSYTSTTSTLVTANEKLYVSDKETGCVYRRPLNLSAGGWEKVLDPASTNPGASQGLVAAMCPDPSGNVWAFVTWQSGGDGITRLFRILPSGTAEYVTTWWPTDPTLTRVGGTFPVGGLEALPDGKIAIRTVARRTGASVSGPLTGVVVVFDPVAAAPTKMIRFLPVGYNGVYQSPVGEGQAGGLFAKVGTAAGGKTLIGLSLAFTPAEDASSGTSDNMVTFLKL